MSVDNPFVFKDPNATIAEGAYRRGFMHGYSMAIDHVEGECSLDQMLHYINEDLVRWRESPGNREIPPPQRTEPETQN